MFSFIKRLFSLPSPQKNLDPEDIVYEFWQTDFAKPKYSRFAAEETESYQTAVNGALTLSIRRRHVFAWTVDPLYNYRNLVLEALIEFPASAAESETGRAGSQAAGFNLRYISESTFYSVLVSDRGLLRMDAVLNGSPLALLGWTGIPQGIHGPKGETDDDENQAPYNRSPNVFSLRIIAQGTSFTLILNDVWVATCEDDSIQAAGKIAFAAQNWGGSADPVYRLRALALDSRPIEVETQYTRWNQYLPISAASRIALAQTWYSMGNFVPALIELKRAWKKAEAAVPDLLLAARIYQAQNMLPDAEEQVLKALEKDSTNSEAITILCSLLYIGDRYKELEAVIAKTDRAEIENSAFLSNLEGHLFYRKKDFPLAAEAYHRAALSEPDQGLYLLNESNAFAASGDIEKELERALEAARLFLADENYDELDELIPRLLDKAPENRLVQAIAGKYWYAKDDPDKAFLYLDALCQEQTPDSAIWYLRGLILSARRQPEDALSSFRKAVELEGDYALYRFRLAEALFDSGEDCSAELDAALKADPENGWVHNLAALKALSDNDLDTAESAISLARKKLPQELTVLINYAEIRRRQGKLEEVLPLLNPDSPRCDNAIKSDHCAALRAAANLLVADGRHSDAEDYYRRAQRLRPFDSELLTDRAANCLELEQLSEADDLLGRAFEQERSVRIYQLISYLSGRKGEYTRAEVALRQGLADFPGNVELLYDLAGVYLATNKADKAREIAEQLREAGAEERSQNLLSDILESSTEALNCSMCGRIWRIPKDIPTQGSLHLTAQPPDDLPAGTCPKCGEHYCIGCAMEKLDEDGRFRCHSCGVPLKLINQGIIWLLNRWAAEA